MVGTKTKREKNRQRYVRARQVTQSNINTTHKLPTKRFYSCPICSYKVSERETTCKLFDIRKSCGGCCDARRCFFTPYFANPYKTTTVNKVCSCFAIDYLEFSNQCYKAKLNKLSGPTLACYSHHSSFI